MCEVWGEDLTNKVAQWLGIGREKADNATPDAIHSWDDPDISLLDDQRGDLPRFPIETLEPEWLRDLCRRAAHGSGTNVDHVMVPFLGISSGLIGTARRSRAVLSWSEPMTDWTFTSNQSPTVGCSEGPFLKTAASFLAAPILAVAGAEYSLVLLIPARKHGRHSDYPIRPHGGIVQAESHLNLLDLPILA
jgi:hypothetical protein